ncbi:diguanylate cyclase with PAS/PAC sensor [Desulfonatronospira thiodismutans ASO3-1]|uniref:Diguanylate cyclase with PAS/PAC sensor n=1 Tax=Desulfonatronospira thiodismutans ASO3-1 TaxID=555779 RepID=D6SRH9_9BACT|nr:diguanylate cyclase [Desulfonatronospira thiodismutans]EFI33295.1 diguanylate cyclase with PAS/PAC sensor [Desulfonatronospira thiodismutans ASO3-1]
MIFHEIQDRFWILNQLPLGIFILDQDMRIQFWNRIMQEWTEHDARTVIGQRLPDMYPELKQPRFEPRIQAVLDGGPPAVFSSHLHGWFIPITNRDGDKRLQNTTIASIRVQESSQWTRLALVTIQDVTELNQRISEHRKVRDQVVEELKKRREIEQRLRREKAFVSKLLDTVDSLVVLLDNEGRIIHFNRACERLSGYSFQDLQGKEIFKRLIPPEEAETVRSFFSPDFANLPHHFENYWLTRAGEKRLIAWSNCIINDEEGNPDYVLGTGIDITEQRRMQERIEHMAMHDGLTGLPNRNLLQDRMEMAIAAAKRTGNRVALLFLDLDGFKAINDNYGHSTGDEVLTLVSRRLKELVRASDTVARFGGDEFVILLTDTGKLEDAKQVARKVAWQLSRPYILPSGEHQLGVSMGISLYPDDAESAEDLMRLADKAMYRVKKSSGDKETCFLASCENV